MVELVSLPAMQQHISFQCTPFKYATKQHNAIKQEHAVSSGIEGNQACTIGTSQSNGLITKTSRISSTQSKLL